MELWVWEFVGQWSQGLATILGTTIFCRGAPLAEPCCAEVHARMKSLRSSVQAEYLGLQVLQKYVLLFFQGALRSKWESRPRLHGIDDNCGTNNHVLLFFPGARRSKWKSRPLLHGIDDNCGTKNVLLFFQGALRSKWKSRPLLHGIDDNCGTKNCPPVFPGGA